jgi:tetratricopeptide (TPR) repeat protein
MNVLRLVLPLLVLCAEAQPASAQIAAGDAAWTAGRYDSARVAYERALTEDPQSVRSLYRLGVLASWTNRIDSALVLLGRARALDPEDPDMWASQAQVFAWGGRLRRSVGAYDSLLALYPRRRDAALGRARALAWDNRFDAADSAYAALLALDPTDTEAMAGRAQVAAWRGDLGPAAAQYRAVLEADPRNLDALVGLGQVHHWQGEDRRASRDVARALAVDSTSRAGLELGRTLRAGSRPQVELTLGWTDDSDGNTTWYQTLGTSVAIAGGLRGFASGGLLQSSGPALDASPIEASRSTGEAGLGYADGPISLTAAAGARRLEPAGAPAFTSRATFRAAGNLRVLPRAVVGAGYARYPFDETALLIGQGLTMETGDLSLEAGISGGLNLSLGAGAAWISDGNSRTSGLIALTQTIRRRFFAGLLARRLSYEQPGVGYFAPDRFTVYEARAGYTLNGRRWEGRISGGLGGQQIFEGADHQLAAHAEARIGRRWALNSLIEIFGGVTNSATSSTTGAYGFRTAGLRMRVGL